MGGGGDPLPICDRCRHFVVREAGLQTCGPCRKGYQLQVSLRSVLTPDNDELAVAFLEGCFGLLEDWLVELRGIEDREQQGDSNRGAARRERPGRREERPRDRSLERKREPTEDEPLKRKIVDSPQKRGNAAHPTSPVKESSTAQFFEPVAHLFPAECHLHPKHHLLLHQPEPKRVLRLWKPPNPVHQGPAKRSRRSEPQVLNLAPKAKEMQARLRFDPVRRNPLRRSCRVREMQARVRFDPVRRNRLRRSCVSSARNAGDSSTTLERRVCGELEDENWRSCSTTLVRGVSGELEDENWRLCSTTVVRGERTDDFVVQL